MSKLGALHLTKYTGAKHTATVIFLHGSGSCGSDMKEWARIMLKTFTFPHIKVIYPTAPSQPYTPAGGEISNVWFDRERVRPDVPEKLESISKIEILVKELIKSENDAGIPNNRIIVGGFSMGGALSFHVAYRWLRDIAGAFVFSSFLNDKSVVYEDLSKLSGTALPPLLQLHGDADTVVDLKWSKNTFRQLKDLGVQGEFHVMEKLGHSINQRGMALIKEFIDKRLPEEK